MRSSTLIHTHDDTTVSTSKANPHLVTLVLDGGTADVSIFMSASRAREIAKVLLADADRCDGFNQERAA